MLTCPVQKTPATHQTSENFRQAAGDGAGGAAVANPVRKQQRK